MEFILLIVAVLIALVIIGKLKGDPDIEKLDVAGLKREIWVTQNWINTYHKGGCPPKYQEKFLYKNSRLEQANAQLKKLTLGHTTNGGNAESDKAEDVEQNISPEMADSVADSEEFKNFVIVDSMRQLTDLASSQGLIQSEEEAVEYWKVFKDRIRNVHLKGKPATIDEIKSSMEKELESVFQHSSVLVNKGVSKELALAQSVVDWYKNKPILAQTAYSESTERIKQKVAEQVASSEIPDDENSQDLLIVDSIRKLTDLAISHGLIGSQDEARKYWECFKDRIRNTRLKGKSATLNEVECAIEDELEPIFQISSGLVNNGMQEGLALAQCVVNWYKDTKFTTDLHAMLLSEEYKAAVKQVIEEQKLNTWHRVGEHEMLGIIAEFGRDARIVSSREKIRDNVVIQCMRIAAAMPDGNNRLALEASAKLLGDLPVIVI